MKARDAVERNAREPDARMTTARRAVDGRLDKAPAVLVGPIPDLDDAAVLARSVSEPDQFGMIYDRYFAEIYRYVAGRLGRDVAEDVAAEAFVVAFRKRDRFNPERGNVRPWLYGIATNLVGGHRREESRRYRALARDARRTPRSVESHDERVADTVTAERLGPRLAVALADLSRRDRDVLLLVAISELSHQEIAIALDIPYGTVGSRLNRARRALRNTLGAIDPRLDPEETSNG